MEESEEEDVKNGEIILGSQKTIIDDQKKENQVLKKQVENLEGEVENLQDALENAEHTVTDKSRPVSQAKIELPDFDIKTAGMNADQLRQMVAEVQRDLADRDQ